MRLPWKKTSPLSTVESADHIKKACFSGPIRTDDGQDFSVLDFQGDGGKSLEFAERQADVLHPKQCLSTVLCFRDQTGPASFQYIPEAASSHSCTVCSRFFVILPRDFCHDVSHP